MKRIALLAAGFSAVFLFAPLALGQSAKTLAGAYAGVAFRVIDAGGKSSDVFGPSPRAMMVLTPDGRYSIIVMRETLPKFASNSRVKGTPEENSAVVTGSLAHFGRYSIDDKAKTITFHVESSTYPNWDGVPQSRPFTVKGDELSYKVAAASGGGGSAEVTWRRLKPAL